MKKTVKGLLSNNPVNRPTSTTLYDVFWRQYYKRLNESFEDKLGLLTLFFMKKNSITELLSYPNGKIEPMEIDLVQMKHNFFAFDQMERLLTNVFKNHDGIKIQIDDIIPFRSEAILDRFLVFGIFDIILKSPHSIKDMNMEQFMKKVSIYCTILLKKNIAIFSLAKKELFFNYLLIIIVNLLGKFLDFTHITP